MNLELLQGSHWPGGIFPLGRARMDWAAAQIARIHSRNPLDWYGEVSVALGLTDATAVETWVSKIGPSPTQATGTKQPDFTSPDRLSFDDVGEAHVLPTVDYSGNTTYFAALVVDRTSGQSAGNVRAGVEFGRYFGAANGVSLFFLQPTERVYVGAGIAGAYTDLYFDNLGSGKHVYAMTLDISLAHPDQLRLWVDGVERSPNGTGAGTGIAGTLGAGSVHIGARDDGAAGLERPLNGDVLAGMTSGTLPTDADIVTLSRALAIRCKVTS